MCKRYSSTKSLPLAFASTVFVVFLFILFFDIHSADPLGNVTHPHCMYTWWTPRTNWVFYRPNHFCGGEHVVNNCKCKCALRCTRSNSRSRTGGGGRRQYHQTGRLTPFCESNTAATRAANVISRHCCCC